MIRVNVGLSRKLSKDYQSTGYSVNVDGEVTAPVSDPEAVVEQVKELFDVAEEALNQQIERAASVEAIAGRDASEGQPTTSKQSDTAKPDNGHEPRRSAGRNGNGQQEEPATNKQINFLLNIGKRQGLTTAQLENKVATILGREVGLYDLTKRSAAVVIDALTKGTEASTARY